MADSSGSNPQSPGFTEKLKSWLCWSWTYICALWFAMVLTMVYVLRSPLKLQETVNAGVCVFMISCVHVYSSTQGIFLHIEGEVQTKMNILPVFFSSPRNTAFFFCAIQKQGFWSQCRSVFSMQCQWMVTEDVKRPKGLRMTIKYYNQWLVHSYNFFEGIL